MLIIGHRGAKGLAAEHTAESIVAALKAGVDGIEVDVRSTSDGVLMLSHDPYVVGGDGSSWKLSQHNFDFLSHRCPHLLTLDALLKLVPTSCQLRVEIKPDEPVEPLGRFLESFFSSVPAAHSHISVVSFDYRQLAELRVRLPHLPLILNESWSGFRARRRAKKLGIQQIQMNQRWLWRGFLRAMRRSGYLITPYTVNSTHQARRWKPFIEGIVTDFPDRFTK